MRLIARGIGLLLLLIVYTMWREISFELGFASFLDGALRGVVVGGLAILLWQKTSPRPSGSQSSQKGADESASIEAGGWAVDSDDESEMSAKPDRDQRRESQVRDEELYLQATDEVEGNVRSPALWAKAMALAEGDDSKAKYKYIKLRVEQLVEQERQEVADPIEPGAGQCNEGNAASTLTSSKPSNEQPGDEKSGGPRGLTWRDVQEAYGETAGWPKNRGDRGDR